MCVNTLPVSVKLLPDSCLQEGYGLYLSIPACSGGERGRAGRGEREGSKRGGKKRGSEKERNREGRREGVVHVNVERDDVTVMQWRNSLADCLN